MMNYKAIALAAIIDIAITKPALAQRFNYLQGTFSDGDWNVNLYLSNIL
ncbi:hypothetical protein [Anabaena sp. FACHB-1237]|nr:hypothetical protein [Anabaena sp. FACHB-1237]